MFCYFVGKADDIKFFLILKFDVFILSLFCASIFKYTFLYEELVSSALYHAVYISYPLSLMCS